MQEDYSNHTQPGSNRIFKVLPVTSWILFDFANTIFSMNIVTLYFANWLIIDNHAADYFYSWTYSGSMFLVLVTMPILGAISDHTSKKSVFLFIFTIMCIVATLLMGVNHYYVSNKFYRVLGALLLFLMANYCYAGGLTFYNALLPSVSSPQNQGKISGYGVAVGYVGSIAGMFMVKPFVDTGGRGAAFIPTAILFLVFSVPIFFFVKDKTREQLEEKTRNIAKLVKDNFEKVKNTIVHINDYPGVLRFLVAKMFYEDPLFTLIVHLGIYLQVVMGFDDSEKVWMLSAFTVTAIIGSLISGYATDKFNPKRVLVFTTIGWTCCFFLVAFTYNRTIFWVLGCVMGMLLGSTWTASRPFLLNLVPLDQTGEFFGLFSLSGKVAAILGPLIWGIITQSMLQWGNLRYRIAIMFLGVLTLIGTILLLKIRLKKEQFG